MNRQILWCVAMLLGFLCLCGCRKEEVRQDEGKMSVSAQPVVEETLPILSKPLKIALHEVDIQALPEFLAHRDKTLVLLTSNPFLLSVPVAARGELEAALRQDSPELQRRLWRVADPLLMPGMLTSAVLDARIFRRIVWVLPMINPQEQIDLEKFKTLLQSVGQDVAAGKFRREANGTIVGEINGIRFDVVPFFALPALTEPVVLHIDLGYFAAIYKNEIKTPLFPLVVEALVKLRNEKYKVGTVTFSYSNHTGWVPLSLRPMGSIIQKIFAEPQIIDAPMPENWKLYGDILYLENFFQNDEILRLLTRMEANAPNEPWVKYLRAKFSRQTKDYVAAERYLAEAVTGDPGYALEYVSQVDAALEEKRTEQVLPNLRKLVAAVPDDPLFRLDLCEELVAQKRFDEVRSMLPALRRLPWSPVYYPNVPASLEYFQKVAEQ